MRPHPRSARRIDPSPQEARDPRHQAGKNKALPCSLQVSGKLAFPSEEDLRRRHGGTTNRRASRGGENYRGRNNACLNKALSFSKSLCPTAGECRHGTIRTVLIARSLGGHRRFASWESHWVNPAVGRLRGPPVHLALCSGAIRIATARPDKFHFSCKVPQHEAGSGKSQAGETWIGVRDGDWAALSSTRCRTANRTEQRHFLHWKENDPEAIRFVRSRERRSPERLPTSARYWNETFPSYRAPPKIRQAAHTHRYSLPSQGVYIDS